MKIRDLEDPQHEGNKKGQGSAGLPVARLFFKVHLSFKLLPYYGAESD